MRIAFVTDALERFGHLPGNAFQLLVRMALTAHDDDLEPAYWAGYEPLARALGRDHPDADADSSSPARRSSLALRTSGDG